MPLFLVRYAVTHVGHSGPEIVREKAHHALLVDAPTRVDAFATAYDHLSRKNWAVSTMLTDSYKDLTETTLNHCDMSDQDLEELKTRGIPVDEFEGNTSIHSVTEHTPQVRGHVISAEPDNPS
jgi:hypothetical protein